MNLVDPSSLTAGFTGEQSIRPVWLLRTPAVKMRAGNVATLDNAAGITLICRCGRLWITQQGDRRDHLIRGGEAFTITREGKTVIEAMCDVEVQMEHAPTRSL